MKKATAQAHSNIALVKYWGKGDEKLRLPVNSSVAVAMDKIYTQTTVEFSEDLEKDIVEIDGDHFSTAEADRVSEHLDLIRTLAKTQMRAKVVTKNNFPKAVGAASSASGFAALTFAASEALHLELSEKDLSIISRQGSGSASRSIPGGFSVWHKGTSSETSFAENISYPSEWDLKILLLFVGDMKQKKISTTDGMRLANTSPYFETAVSEAESNVKKIQNALKNGDWKQFGKIIEDECFRLHTVCMTSTPNILYWNGTSVEIMQSLLSLREEGVDGFFTCDAGPHIHVICKKTDLEIIKGKLEKIAGVRSIVECEVGKKAHLIEKHLF